MFKITFLDNGEPLEFLIRILKKDVNIYSYKILVFPLDDHEN